MLSQICGSKAVTFAVENGIMPLVMTGIQQNACKSARSYCIQALANIVGLAPQSTADMDLWGIISVVMNENPDINIATISHSITGNIAMYTGLGNRIGNPIAPQSLYKVFINRLQSLHACKSLRTNM